MIFQHRIHLSNSTSLAEYKNVPGLVLEHSTNEVEFDKDISYNMKTLEPQTHDIPYSADTDNGMLV